jgi:serine/threonine protein kinase
MYSLGVLLFVMLTGCKPIPSAICSKLSYDTMLTSDYPGLKMSQFRRCSPAARDLVVSLMQRRPNDRPNALKALSHSWLRQHAHAWRKRGYELTYLAIREHKLRAVLTASPSADLLLVRARAEHPFVEGGQNLQSQPSQGSSRHVSRPRRAADMPGSVPLSGARERYEMQAATFSRSSFGRRNSTPLPLPQSSLPSSKTPDGNAAQAALPLQESRGACLRLWRPSGKPQYEATPPTSGGETHRKNSEQTQVQQNGGGLADNEQENQRPTEPLGNRMAHSQSQKQAGKTSRRGALRRAVPATSRHEQRQSQAFGSYRCPQTHWCAQHAHLMNKEKNFPVCV